MHADQTQSDRLDRRWQKLPAVVKTDQQVAGRAAVGCGATHSLMERCNLACTSCYLTDIANTTPPLAYDLACAQLDQLRAWLGPKGKVQLTSGEVTLLPVEDLGALVRYARSIGLDPMLMTNGVRVLAAPEYLHELVQEYGLRKVCFHVDSTQRGRRGITSLATEREQDPIRLRCAELIAATRRATGQRLDAAHTVTVTRDNIGEIHEIVRWFLDHSREFRLLSLLPVADVGRTTDAGAVDGPVAGNADAVWAEVELGVGQRLNRHAMHFGHSACNINVPLLLVETGDRRELLEVVREGKSWDLRIFRRLTKLWGPTIDFSEKPLKNAGRLLMAGLRNPLLWLELPLYTAYRLAAAQQLVRRAIFGLFALRPVRVRPILFVVHTFMDAETMATDEGQERLDACIFKLPVDGEMVSMCEMNASSMRLTLNQNAQEARRP